MNKQGLRRIIFVMACVIAAFCVVAQTQQGLVKTRSKKKGVPGTPLPSATIQVKGRNPVVSAASGKFSFPVPAAKYYLQSAKKQGYELVDPDILLRPYTYSSNPLIILMETPEQKKDDVQSAVRKIRRTLQDKINAKEDLIEQLKEENKITQQQYREAMKALDNERERNGQLINEMAERYAQMDYDQMDEFNQRVNDLILDGDLTQADSLLRTKGDINSRLAAVQREEEAQAAEAAELARRQQDLDASRAGTRAVKNDIAQDCYHYFNMFVLNMQPDSALYYIEKRASIDPHNFNWQMDAISYCLKRGLTQKADDHLQQVLQQMRQLASESPEEHEPQLAWTLEHAATLLTGHQPQDARATGYFQEAANIYEKLAEENPQIYRPYLAEVLNNFAMNYPDRSDRLDRCEPLFKQALDIYWQFAQEDARAYISRVADVQNNMAQLYDQAQQFNKSEQCYQQALGIYSKLAESDPKAYNPNVAATLNNLSALYYRNGRDGEQPLLQALEIYRQLYQENPQLYGPQLAVALNNLAVQYYGEGRDDEGEKVCNEALEAFRKITGYNATEYTPLLAQRLYEQAIRLYKDERIGQSEPLFQESLTLFRDLAKHNPADYQPQVAKVLRNLATAYDKMNRLPDGEKMYQEELAINQELAQQEPSRYKADVARSYGNLSNHALLMKDYSKAVDLARKGLAVDDSKLFIQANLAAAYLFMGETASAEEIYTRYKSQLHDVFLDDLQEFSSRGIIPKERQADVEHIRRLLAQ